MAVAQTCITSTSVHDVDKAIGVPPKLATAGGETPVASWRPCFLSSVLIFVVRASPVPSVVASFSAPAESVARICVHNANMPQRLGNDGYARDRSGIISRACSRFTLVSTLTLPARRRPSVMERMSTLAAVVPAVSATATLYLPCLA